MSDLRNQLIVVTGASSGIGRATARRLAAKGATVVAVARNQERLAHLAKSVPNVHARPADLTSAADRGALVDAVLARYGRIDALVNNAGIGWQGLIEEMESGDIDRLVTTNFTAVVDLTRLVLPGMLERGRGHVVITSSSAAWFAFPPLSVYAATKSAVNAFADGLRREVWGRGVIVSTVNPGPVATEWLARSEGYEPRDADPQVQPLPGGVPPEWVAAAIERCLSRPYPRVVGVPRVMELARLLALPPLRLAADLVFNAQAANLARLAKRLAEATTPTPAEEREYHHRSTS